MVFTEKNKQTGLPYLNPNFITYLTMSNLKDNKSNNVLAIIIIIELIIVIAIMVFYFIKRKKEMI